MVRFPLNISVTYRGSQQNGFVRSTYIAFGSGDTLSGFSPQHSFTTVVFYPDTSGDVFTDPNPIFVGGSFTPDTPGSYDLLIAVAEDASTIDWSPNPDGGDVDSWLVQPIDIQ